MIISLFSEDSSFNLSVAFGASSVMISLVIKSIHNLFARSCGIVKDDRIVAFAFLFADSRFIREANWGCLPLGGLCCTLTIDPMLVAPVRVTINLGIAHYIFFNFT